MSGPRLHVLLGDGGVGKTTLAAGYALALAQGGRRVGLLGVDPARRLSGALGIGELAETGTEVPGVAGLRAALLRPEESLRRWAAEECRDAGSRERLLANPFFLALADRMAGAADALAAIRVGEWAERDPLLEDLVVDTAPGLHGIELLRQPEKLLALLRGRLLRWMRHLAASLRDGEPAVPGAARRVLRGLAGLGGARALASLAELAWLIQDLSATLIARLERTRAWLREGQAELLVACAPRAGAEQGARQICAALAEAGCAPSAVVLNRALPEAALAAASALEPGDAFLRYARNAALLQRRVQAALGALSLPVIAVASVQGLDGPERTRLAALTSLGAALRAQLA